MLLAIEVAVEYWLALTWSPQAQWLNEVAKSGIIQDEVRPTCQIPFFHPLLEVYAAKIALPVPAHSDCAKAGIDQDEVRPLPMPPA
jgi:hypothetical protein